MTEYTDTTIIECNNQASSEVRAGNLSSPASYTNKLDNSLRLQRGDKVSVDYCFVNERGCGTPNAVEIKGISLDQSKSWYVIDKKSEGIEPVATRTRMETSLYQTLKPTLITKTLRDDVAHVETNYYKEANCEGYYFLPRRFAYEPLPTTEPNVGAFDNETNLPDIYEGLVFTTAPGTGAGTALSTIKPQSPAWWDTHDTFASGRCFSETGYQSGDDVESLCMADYQLFFNDTKSLGYYRPRNDGTRYTIICREEMIQDKTYNTETASYWDNNTRDPALGKYNIYNELIELTLPIGFNSPENIATRLTEQLQKTQEEELYTLEDNGFPPTERIWTSTISTNTFKPFNCAWYGGNGKTQYDSYVADDGSGSTDALNYDCSYQYLGVKRPDLFIAGRATMLTGGEQIFIRETITPPAGTGENVMSDIMTGWLYTKENLEKLSTLFKTQERYPELWKDNPIVTGTDYTIDNSRFLHINRYNNVDGAIGNILGYDNYETKGDGKNRASMPFFFKYDKANENLFTSGTDTSNLSYGFATKRRETFGDGTFKEFIVLHPELIGGIRLYVFKYNASIVKDTTLIGWDHHFNSYGNAVIQLYSGYQKFTYNNEDSFGVASQIFDDTLDPPPLNEGRYLPPVKTAPLISRMYLGANNPSVVYDATSHFGFKDLHTPENVGQPFDAGKSAGVEADNATASTICYKMNKRLQYWTYTPEMRPYNVGKSKAYGVVAGALASADIEVDRRTISDSSIKELTGREIGWGEVDYSKLNEAITPYTIMDAHGGIALNIGASYGEDTFNDGLFGLLGFTYKQTNPSIINSVNNRLARITNTNLYNLEWITTNAQIVETQIQNFVVNRYGAIMFSSQVQTPIILEGWINQRPFVTGGTSLYPARLSASTIYPPIVETTSSIVVFAELLPRRMVRPYYCIRSDLVLHERQKYIGGKDSGDSLPIIAVVNKENGDGDYFFSVDSPIQFTITNDINVSSIKTSIHDPDQSLASVGDGCSVIYRIERNKVLDNSIVEEILNKKMKK